MLRVDIVARLVRAPLCIYILCMCMHKGNGGENDKIKMTLISL